ncbi:MAG: M60 family metallopeptidase [Rikenellaceae bacterium]
MLCRYILLLITILWVNVTLAISIGDVLDNVKTHIDKGTLSAVQISAAESQIESSMPEIVGDKKLLTKAFDVVSAYEHSPRYGALFVNEATVKGLNRKKREGNEIHFAVAAIMQGLVDYAYTSDNLSRYGKILSGAKFETSSLFPGYVPMPKGDKACCTSKINASNAKSWGSPTSNETKSARRPTGCYVAPGSIVRVRVPDSMVGCGFAVRVGAHSWNHAKKPTMKRLDRVSILYPITASETLVGSPLGGGVYIEVPYLADLGVVEVEVQNAVRSPYFSARSFDRMTNEEWRASERQNPGAWADFESDKFMMQVPSSWIYNYDNPEQLMADWDKAMDVIFQLRGLDPDQFNKSLLYLQVDVQMRGAANFPGYPQANYPYNPLRKESGNKDYWMIESPAKAPWSVFHELGHSILITKFRGETEALVNLMHVAIMNRAFGVDIDSAFGDSVEGKSQLSLDDVAVMWMVTENFREGREMNYSNRPGDEFKYQHRGYAKYVEIAKLYGWEALDRFWHSANEDYMGAKSYYPKNQNQDPVDSRILRMSIAAGEDITPLIHFWGIHPQNPERLRAQIAEAGLKPSSRIHDRLNYYLSIIPKDNSAFRQHTSVVYPKGLKITKKSNPMYGEGWYSSWQDIYNQEHYAKGVEALSEIIELYY